MFVSVLSPSFSYLDAILPIIKDGLSTKGRKQQQPSPSSTFALMCISMLARAVGSKLTPYISSLIGLPAVLSPPFLEWCPIVFICFVRSPLSFSFLSFFLSFFVMYSLFFQSSFLFHLQLIVNHPQPASDDETRQLMMIALIAPLLSLLPFAFSFSLDPMFAGGLNETLIEALTELASHIPELLPDLQDRLLAMISSILAPQAAGLNADGSSNSSSSSSSSTLSGAASATTLSSSLPSSASFSSLHRSLYSAPSLPSLELFSSSFSSPSLSALGITVSSPSSFGLGDRGSSSSSGNSNPSFSDASLRDQELITLALKTLGSFDLKARDLLPFVRESVVCFLDDDNASIRKEAALTCAQLILRPGMLFSRLVWLFVCSGCWWR